ncbi:bombyxin A-3 homolog [Galleria mellonella]|uniref:Bombyxin A-3 homolog n=1 Tax=Galleria mellonella TaxID=7137 RepID=A0A6J3CBE4_GALME|nr:bombyxin A-3 homolog [Galleria mellonella]WLY76841.1 insulin-like peptide transcript variant X5 [Galleria mellonella]
MKFLVLLFALSAILYTTSGNSVQFYCGRRLSEALAYLCTEENVEKRSFNSIPNEEYSWSIPAFPKFRALEGVRGKRQGVATECCEKACTLSELLSYC